MTQYNVGTRITLAHDVERFPHFIAKAGLTGVVNDVGGEYWDGNIYTPENVFVSVRLDAPLAGAEEWDNCIIWDENVLGLYDDAEDIWDCFRHDVGADVFPLSPEQAGIIQAASENAAEIARDDGEHEVLEALEGVLISASIDLRLSPLDADLALEWLEGLTSDDGALPGDPAYDAEEDFPGVHALIQALQEFLA